MDNNIIKYISPITVEAKIFLDNLESLSKTYNNVDIAMISTLEKIVETIENLLDTTPNKIVETKKTELVNCENVSNIRRIFNCTLCRRDIGKSTEKVALHLAEGCDKAFNTRVCDVLTSKTAKRKEKNNELSVRKKTTSESKNDQASKLTKKTRSLLTSNLNPFIDEHIQIAIKLQSMPIYEKIENDLLTLARPLFPNSTLRVYKFGSRIAGIGNRDSDLDLFMDIGDMFTIYQQHADSKACEKLRAVQKAMKGKTKCWKNLVAIVDARVPILKVVHAESGIACDINFSNSLGVVNTRYLEYMFNLQPMAQSLCCFTKKWLQRTKLSEKINTYSMNLMVIFFLQNLGALPSVKQLQKNINRKNAVKIGVWVCTYVTYSLKELNLTPITKGDIQFLRLAKQFFEFYTQFNFNVNVISPYLGETIKRSVLEREMPDRYHNYVKSSPTSALQKKTPLVVQDPFQLDHNTTKNINAATLKILEESMDHSLKILNEVTKEKHVKI